MTTLARSSIAHAGPAHSAARLALSLPLFGLSAGVVLRLYRWAALSAIAPHDWAAWMASMALGVGLLCMLAAAHLSNFSLGSWRWRAPALGVFIALGEGATCLVMTLARQEQLGSATATLADWPASALEILASRVLIVTVFAGLLAVVYWLLKKAG